MPDETDNRPNAGRSETSKPPESPPTKPPPAAAEPERQLGRAAKKIQRQLEDLLAGATIGLATIDPRRAQVLNESAEDLARVWARLADESPAVRRYLEGMLSGSAWGEAILVTSLVAIRMLPESFELPTGAFFGGGSGTEDEVPPSPEVTLQQEADELARQRAQRQREAEGRSAAPQSAPEAPSGGDDGSDDDAPGPAA